MSATHMEDFYRNEYQRRGEQLAALVKAADDLHRITVLDYDGRSEWQRLGVVLDEVAPTTFNRVTGELHGVSEVHDG